MYSYQMIGVADENGKKYKSKYGTYDKTNGFVFDKDVALTPDFINRLFHDDLWKLGEPERRKMSLKDIEKELGYRVQIVDPEINKPAEEKKELSNEQKGEINDLVDLFHRLFDIDIDQKKYY